MKQKRIHLKWTNAPRARCGVLLRLASGFVRSKKKFRSLGSDDKCKGCDRSLATDRS